MIAISYVDRSNKFKENVRKCAYHFNRLAKRLKRHKLIGTIREPEYSSVDVEFAYYSQRIMRIPAVVSVDVGQFIKLRPRKLPDGSDSEQLYNDILDSEGFVKSTSVYGSFVKKVSKKASLYLTEYPAGRIVLGIGVVHIKLGDLAKYYPKSLRRGEVDRNDAEIMIIDTIVTLLENMP